MAISWHFTNKNLDFMAFHHQQVCVFVKTKQGFRQQTEGDLEEISSMKQEL